MQVRVGALERFRLAAGRDTLTAVETLEEMPLRRCRRRQRPAHGRPGPLQWCAGSISAARSAWPDFAYKAGRVFAGEPVEVVCDAGLVELVSKGVVIATHAQVRRRDDPKPTAAASRSETGSSSDIGDHDEADR